MKIGRFMCGLWGHHFIHRGRYVYCLHCGHRIDGAA